MADVFEVKLGFVSVYVVRYIPMCVMIWYRVQKGALVRWKPPAAIFVF